MMPIATVADLMRALRMGPYTRVGSYPTFFLTDEGDTLSHAGLRSELWEAARLVRDGARGRVVAMGVNYEDPNMVCAASGAGIESAYA